MGECFSVVLMHLTLDPTGILDMPGIKIEAANVTVRNKMVIQVWDVSCKSSALRVSRGWNTRLSTALVPDHWGFPRHKSKKSKYCTLTPAAETPREGELSHPRSVVAPTANFATKGSPRWGPSFQGGQLQPCPRNLQHHGLRAVSGDKQASHTKQHLCFPCV